MAILKQPEGSGGVVGTGVANPPPRSVTSVATKPSFDNEKDKRIWVSGILQAVINSPSLIPFVTRREDFATLVEEETRKMLDVHKRLTDGV